MPKKTVSFLASGRGSNFTAVAEKIISGEIKVNLGILIVDKEDAKAIQVAEKYKMKAYFIDPKKYNDRKSHEIAIVAKMKECETDLIVAAGYMRLLTPYILKEYKNRIINIHPALLPAFPGVNGQKQAFDYGVKVAGCTAHFIDEGTDTGAIILQSVVAVDNDDTLKTLSIKILKEEHQILPKAVNLFCKDKLIVEGRKVIIKK